VAAAAALASVAGAALLLAAWSDRQRRAWALVAIAGAVLYFALRGLPLYTGGGRVLGEQWNWSGHLLALAGTLALGGLLVRRAGLGAPDLGFAWPAAPALAAAAVLLAASAGYSISAVSGGRLDGVSGETWLFLATMPGIAEEVAFRGVLLAAAERAAPAARQLAGVPVSVGAGLLTAAFVGLHGFGLGTAISVLPAALLYLWLRLRSGSVLPPIVAHNLWNLGVLAAHT
jgi:membrane protease YdiL (CAAX protease family)